ncbi:ABC transporter ATP-binding protein/permease [[Eubacterium] siraeum]|nr:ABC transporter ATP-binding protein/permease [[Eubacterium] siraeum]
MMDKRLIGTVKESKKYIAGNVITQWISLIANIAMMTAITVLLSAVFTDNISENLILVTAVTAGLAVIIRAVCSMVSSKMSYLSSKEVKRVLREKIYRKLLKLGASYNEQIKTSEVVQVAVEGVDQLETYFGAYLPQFFYAMLAPLTLFIYICFINVASAIVLLVCVPMIPVAIALVQTWAKKLLSRYWNQYTALGDTFLENLQGLTTLKIYKSDAYKNDVMNEEAEKFRKITMKVLTMQLNSVTIMDVIAYGGAALGVIMAVTQYIGGAVSLQGAMLIILLSADFFIPMRQLGSFFHIAMNGMAASEKIFRLLELPENDNSGCECPKGDIVCENLSFSYNSEREILHGINFEFPKDSFTALVGESGCGKSTIASILTGKNKSYGGRIKIGNEDFREISEKSLMEHITYISNKSYLFKGTVRDNLLIGKPTAVDKELWTVLERVRLSDFIKSENGLDTVIAEKGGNLSGGQCQRLALARALLHDSEIYIFDEATSNIDIDSENDIMKEIKTLAKEKTVILISHRLANVTDADRIYVIDGGNITESGTHSVLLSKNGDYARLWNAQQSLENYGKDGAAV